MADEGADGGGDTGLALPAGIGFDLTAGYLEPVAEDVARAHLDRMFAAADVIAERQALALPRS